MTFDVAADAYTRFMGRFSEPLAVEFTAMLTLKPGDRALDVGCGPGALTAVLVAALGETAVSAIDPSVPFVESVRSRFPGVDTQLAAAEHLPYADDTFDLCTSQLVVHFMTDPVAGIREMARVTKPSGTIAVNTWDFANGDGPLAPFPEVRRSLDPQSHAESALPGTAEGDLERLFSQAGIENVRSGVATVRVRFASFDEWWEPFTLGVGPVGEYMKTLTTAGVAALRHACAERLPSSGSFETVASAWVAIGTAPHGQ